MARRTANWILMVLWLTTAAALAAPEGPTVPDLAALAPAEATAFAAFVPRPGSGFDVVAWKATLDPGTLQQVAQAEDWLGTSLEDLFTWARPSGFGAVLSGPTVASLALLSGQDQGEVPDLVVALALRDRAAARRAVERFVALHDADLGLRLRGQEGVSLWAPREGGSGPALALEKGYLLVGTTSGVVRLTRSWRQSAPDLRRNPRFQEALAQVPARQGAFLYAPVRSVLTGMHPGGRIEEEILEAARVLDYLVVGEVQRGGRWTTETYGQLHSRTSSPLAWPLLIPARPSADLAGWFPNDVACYVSIEIEILYRPLVAVVRWSGALGGAFPGGSTWPAGTLVQALDALEGRLAAAVDLGPDGDAEPGVLLAAGVSDPQGVLGTAARLESAVAEDRVRKAYQGCAANITALSSALDAYRSENSGQYPARLALLVPDFLPELPVCPAAGVDTYSAGYRRPRDSGGCRVACQGRHHQDLGVGPDVPAYASDSGLDTPEGAAQVAPVERLTHRVQGTDLHGYAGLPLRWALGVRGSERVLLLGFGPRAEELLGRSLRVASPRDSLAGDPAYRGLLEDSRGTVLATGLVRGRLLARALQGALAGAPTSVREVFDGLAPEDAVGYVSMESGGLRSVSTTSLSSELSTSLGRLLRSLARMSGATFNGSGSPTGPQDAEPGS